MDLNTWLPSIHPDFGDLTHCMFHVHVVHRLYSFVYLCMEVLGGAETILLAPNL